MPASSSPLGNIIRYAIWLADTVCFITECHRIGHLGKVCTSPPNLLLQTVLRLSAPIWTLVGPPSLVVFLHIYQTPTLATTTRTRELFHGLVTFYGLHIFGLISESVLGGDARALAWSIGFSLVWQWSAYLELVILGRSRMAEKWFLLPVDQHMRHEDEDPARHPKIRDAMWLVQKPDEDESDENEEELKDLIEKRVAVPVGARTTNEAEEKGSDLAEEWINVLVNAEI